MPKQKTRKSAAKRFKISKKGQVIFSHQLQGHLMRKKSKRRIRRQKEPGILTGVFAQRVKRMIGNV